MIYFWYISEKAFDSLDNIYFFFKEFATLNHTKIILTIVLLYWPIIRQLTSPLRLAPQGHVRSVHRDINMTASKAVRKKAKKFVRKLADRLNNGKFVLNCGYYICTGDAEGCTCLFGFSRMINHHSVSGSGLSRWGWVGARRPTAVSVARGSAGPGGTPG